MKKGLESKHIVSPSRWCLFFSLSLSELPLPGDVVRTKKSKRYKIKARSLHEPYPRLWFVSRARSLRGDHAPLVFSSNLRYQLNSLLFFWWGWAYAHHYNNKSRFSSSRWLLLILFHLENVNMATAPKGLGDLLTVEIAIIAEFITSAEKCLKSLN